MNKKNLQSGRDKELQKLADDYEAARAENKTIYFDADDLADLADWYAIRGKYQIASEAVEYGLNLHPENTTLLVELAYLLIDTQNRDKAKEIIGRISEDYSSEVKVLKANILLGESQIEAAEQLLDSIEDKDDLGNIIDITYMYLDMGYPQKAKEWIDLGTKRHADHEAYIAVKADYLYSRGMKEEAEAAYNELIDKNPYSASYWFGLARSYFDQQKFDKSIEACDYAIIADEEFAEAYLMKGHAFYQLGNEESALESYTQAEKYEGVTSSFLHMFIGLSNISTGNWEVGYTHLEQAIASEDVDSLTLPSMYSHAALCLHKMGKKRKAHQYCKKAQELCPEDEDSYIIEGRIYMEEGNYDKAVKKWAVALEHSPYAETWNEIGMCSMEIGQLGYAKLAFERVREMEPDFKNINEKLTALYMLLKDKENFFKYNKLCENPFELEELEKLEQLLTGEDKEELANVMKNILNALQ